MSGDSVGELLARLDGQIAYHREREAFHAQQEAFHGEQRSAHAAELEKLGRHREALGAAVSAAAALARQPRPASPGVGDHIGPSGKPKLARMVARIVADRSPTEPFGAAAVAREIEYRFQADLKKPVDSRLVSIELRRLADRGHLHLARRGRPHAEALYVRQRPGSG
ncbi:MAG TPA: hypothetical protein VEW48_09895 [Thermoanaerobaculia bacterium]|nr:hypothetical protein [Thermoanaerobaculia bacterium]